MPLIQVSKSIPRPAREAYESLRNQFDRKEGLGPLGEGIPSISWNDEKMAGSFCHGKVEGTFTVTGECPCMLNIEIQLPLMMTPLKGLIQKTLQERLESIQ